MLRKIHMYNLNAVTRSTVNQSGGHSFSMTFKKDAKGNLQVLMEEELMIKIIWKLAHHGATFGNSFSEVKFFFNGNGDHDNDGVVKGLQDEVWGMINKVMTELENSWYNFQRRIWTIQCCWTIYCFPVPKQLGQKLN